MFSLLLLLCTQVLGLFLFFGWFLVVQTRVESVGFGFLIVSIVVSRIWIVKQTAVFV